MGRGDGGGPGWTGLDTGCLGSMRVGNGSFTSSVSYGDLIGVRQLGQYLTPVGISKSHIAQRIPISPLVFQTSNSLDWDHNVPVI